MAGKSQTAVSMIYGLCASLFMTSFVMGCSGRTSTKNRRAGAPSELDMQMKLPPATPGIPPASDGHDDGGGDSGGGDDAGEEIEFDPTIAKIAPGVGIKNFRQIQAVMSELTTVPKTEPTVAAEYAKLTTQLPETNDIRAFMGSHQVAIAKLAVEFCNAMVNSPAAVMTVLPGINLAQAPAVALNPEGRDAINKALIERFWGSGLATLPDLSQSLATLSKLTDELLTGKDPNDATLTPNVVKALCTAVLASGPVTFQ